MNQRSIWAFWLVGLAGPICGCQVMDTQQPATSAANSAWKLNAGDYRDSVEESVDPWEFVGRDARGGRSREVDPDPWYRRLFMSSKARAIESNVGIE